jgi:aspartate 1-decarboxylase
MLRPFLRAKIHRARVTRCDVDYVGSITVDGDLLEACDLLPLEQVDVYNVTRGSRLATYAIEGDAGSGAIEVNGAAAHLARRGDLVIIAAYAQMTAEEATAFTPRLVFVDGRNRIAETKGAERPRTAAPAGRL